MIPARNHTRETYIRMIENQPLIENRYSRIRRLTNNAGDGRFSLMFTAFDPVANQEVALKFFDPSCLHDVYRVECFAREIEMLQMFRGRPNILQVIDAKSTLMINVTTPEGLTVPFNFPFFATELAQEGNLRGYIYSSATSAKQNLSLFWEMCKAVQRIHAKQVCHRDVKPSNFLIFRRKDPHEKLKLSDFGTARSFDRNAEPLLQRYGGPPGDHFYTSPELLCGLGSEEQFAFSNDFYSLGAILFEMFAKTYLSLAIFNNSRNIRDLVRYFSITRERDRKEIFDSFITQIARSKPLPDIFVYNQEVPNCIKNQLNSLYKSLANLDYRRRLNSFARIFIQTGICISILDNEQKYRKWRQLKKRLKKLK